MSDFLGQLVDGVIFEVEYFQFEQFFDLRFDVSDFIIAEVDLFEGSVHGVDFFGNIVELLMGEVEYFLIVSFGVAEEESDLGHILGFNLNIILRVSFFGI